MNLAFTAFIKSKGYTTKGALADACGMDRTVFCDRCRGRSPWLWKEACKVCSVLDITLDEFATYYPVADVIKTAKPAIRTKNECICEALDSLKKALTI